MLTVRVTPVALSLFAESLFRPEKGVVRYVPKGEDEDGEDHI